MGKVRCRAWSPRLPSACGAGYPPVTQAPAEPRLATLVAPFALLIWIPICFAMFASLRASQAAFVSLLGAEILLPVGYGFKFVGLPDLERGRVAGLSALVACLLFKSHSFRVRGRLRVSYLMIGAIILSAAATVATNPDPVVWGRNVVLPGLRPYDAAAVAAGEVLDYGLPFLLGAAVFRSRRDLEFLLRGLAVAGLVYTLPILYEVRMSPQLHNIVYGYFPSSFLQQIREGGFRPVVFIGHGLAVSMFMMMTTVAAVGLWRARLPILSWPAGACAAYLFVVLFLCKSYAPAVYALIASALLIFAGTRACRTVAWASVLFLLSYPLLRTFDWVPTDRMVEIARSMSEDRAGSLQFRFDNEQMLLERAHERIWFGWGTWSRNRVFDPEEGRDISVTDGLWIIELGRFGVAGFLAQFSMLLVPMAFFRHNVPRLRSERARLLLCTLALILGCRAVDFVPNSGFTPFVALLFGALAGLSVGLPLEESAARHRSLRGGEKVARAPGPARLTESSGWLPPADPPARRFRRSRVRAPRGEVAAAPVFASRATAPGPRETPRARSPTRGPGVPPGASRSEPPRPPTPP